MNAAQRKKARTAREFMNLGRVAHQRIADAEARAAEAIADRDRIAEDLVGARNDLSVINDECEERTRSLHASSDALGRERAARALADAAAQKAGAELAEAGQEIMRLRKLVQDLEDQDRDAASLRRRLAAKTTEIAKVADESRQARAVLVARVKELEDQVSLAGQMPRGSPSRQKLAQLADMINTRIHHALELAAKRVEDLGMSMGGDLWRQVCAQAAASVRSVAAERPQLPAPPPTP